MAEFEKCSPTCRHAWHYIPITDDSTLHDDGLKPLIHHPQSGSRP